MNTHDIEQQRAAFEVAKAEIWCYINADDDAFAIWSAAWQTAIEADRKRGDINLDYKQLYEQMCNRCDVLDKALGQYESQRNGEPIYQASYRDGFWQDCSSDRYEYLHRPEHSERADWKLRVLFTAPQPATPDVEESLTVAEPVKVTSGLPVTEQEDEEWKRLEKRQ